MIWLGMHHLAAVDVNCLAGDIVGVGRGEIGAMAPNSGVAASDRGRDSLDLIRDPCHIALALFSGSCSWPADQTDTLSGVFTMPGERQLARTLKGAKSLAMTCMKLMTAALAAAGRIGGRSSLGGHRGENRNALARRAQARSNACAYAPCR